MEIRIHIGHLPDLVSRGVGPDKLLSSSLWWQGHSFLKNEKDWPNNLSNN